MVISLEGELTNGGRPPGSLRGGSRPAWAEHRPYWLRVGRVRAGGAGAACGLSGCVRSRPHRAAGAPQQSPSTIRPHSPKYLLCLTPLSAPWSERATRAFATVPCPLVFHVQRSGAASSTRARQVAAAHRRFASGFSAARHLRSCTPLTTRSAVQLSSAACQLRASRLQAVLAPTSLPPLPPSPHTPRPLLLRRRRCHAGRHRPHLHSAHSHTHKICRAGLSPLLLAHSSGGPLKPGPQRTCSW